MGNIQNVKKAKDWLKFLEKNYSNEIKEQIKNTVSIRGDIPFLPEVKIDSTEIDLYDCGTTQAVLRLNTNNFNTALLNFASYKNPGGGFLGGAIAQEEVLCHETSLYPVITEFKDYYNENRKKDNKHLYTNAALYTPDVLVFDKFNLKAKCDVITCAAPNVRAALRKTSMEEITYILESRIDFMFSVAQLNGVEQLVLGAWGCGVFGCDPNKVSDIMLHYLNTKYKGVFKRVVFAIPNKNGENYKAFERTINNYKQEVK